MYAGTFCRRLVTISCLVVSIFEIIPAKWATCSWSNDPAFRTSKLPPSTLVNEASATWTVFVKRRVAAGAAVVTGAAAAATGAVGGALILIVVGPGATGADSDLLVLGVI